MEMLRGSKSFGLTRQCSHFIFNNNSLVEQFVGGFLVCGNGFEPTTSQQWSLENVVDSNASCAGNEKVPFKSYIFNMYFIYFYICVKIFNMYFVFGLQVRRSWSWSWELGP
jgi:hypothetical protein